MNGFCCLRISSPEADALYPDMAKIAAIIDDLLAARLTMDH